MPHSLPPGIVVEKNKLNSSFVWLSLMQFDYDSESPVRLCLDNEYVTWNGNVYHPAGFTPPTITETKEAQVNELPFTVVDINRGLTPLIEQFNGAVGAIVTLSIVHSDHLDHTTAEREDVFEVISTAVDDRCTITFKLGQENLISRRCPSARYLKNACRFKFKDSRCGYSGAATECSLTLSRCRDLGNQQNFGGFPGVGGGGYFLS